MEWPVNAAHVLNQRIAKSFCFRPLPDILTRQSNAPPGGPHFGSNSRLYAASRESNARGLPGGEGWFWNWLVHNRLLHVFSSFKIVETAKRIIEKQGVFATKRALLWRAFEVTYMTIRMRQQTSWEVTVNYKVVLLFTTGRVPLANSGIKDM